MKNSYEIHEDFVVVNVIKKGVEYAVIVDKEDFPVISSFDGTWHLNNRGYISRTLKGKRESIHRVIMKPQRNLVVDHIDGNRLNNKKENLRIITRGQNSQNIKSNKRSKTGIRGVSYDSRWSKWRARMTVDGKEINLGTYDSVEEAEKAAIAGRSKYMKYSKEVL